MLGFREWLNEQRIDEKINYSVMYDWYSFNKLQTIKVGNNSFNYIPRTKPTIEDFAGFVNANYSRIYDIKTAKKFFKSIYNINVEPLVKKAVSDYIKNISKNDKDAYGIEECKITYSRGTLNVYIMNVVKAYGDSYDSNESYKFKYSSSERGTVYATADDSKITIDSDILQYLNFSEPLSKTGYKRFSVNHNNDDILLVDEIEITVNTYHS